jgi:peroxiredoxin
VEVLDRFAKKREITYPLLSDVGSRVIDAYGVRNLEAKGSRIDGVPHPATFIVDKNGVIRAKLFREGYRERHSADELIEALGKTGP